MDDRVLPDIDGPNSSLQANEWVDQPELTYLGPPPTAANLYAFASFNPARPPNWRWRLASFCVAERPKDVHDLDDVTYHAAVWMLGVPPEDLDDDIDRELMAAIGAASRLARDASGAIPMRAQVEALLLAGESEAAIAERTGIDVAVVRAYERLFFDIRAAADSNIQHVVIGSPSVRPLSEDDPARILKHFAWLTGPLVAAEVRAYLENSHRFDDWLAEAPSDEVRIDRLRSRIAVRTSCLHGGDDPIESVAILKLHRLTETYWKRPIPEFVQVPGFELSGAGPTSVRLGVSPAIPTVNANRVAGQPVKQPTTHDSCVA